MSSGYFDWETAYGQYHNRFPGYKKQPVIGITGNFGEKGCELAEGYFESILKAGATPVIFPPFEDRDALANVLEHIDGLLLSGGGDLNPLFTGEEPIPQLHSVNYKRDLAELLLIRLAYDRQIPILGICRGIQMLNVVLGGTLKQDIPNHRVSETSDDPIWHDVRIAPSTRLAQIAGTDHARVNSYHHQAIDRLADGLVATAWAEDGTIEAMEMPGERFFVGLQWHPEKSLREDELSKAVFKAMRAAMH